jgi:fused signal recognition particle receptor
MDEFGPSSLLLLAVAAAMLVIVGAFVVVHWRRLSGRPVPAAPRPPVAPSASSIVQQTPTARLRGALGRTRDALARRMAGMGLGGRAEVWLDAIEEALITADVGVATTQSLVRELRARLAADSTPEAAVAVLGSVLLGHLIQPPAGAPAAGGSGGRVILVMGVNGVGKTTTIGKLAARYARDGQRVLLVAGDTFRAAAAEQLERWAERAGAAFIRQGEGADPAAVVVDGLRSARSRGVDVVIVDTAGRMHTKANLMEELRKIRRVIAREWAGAPHETLLVLDASTGQNGLQQARLFKEAVEITGAVLTKMDGTAKGGIAIAVAAELGLPIRYIGLGEAVEDLEAFDATIYVDAILPDLAELRRGPPAVDRKG